MVRLAKPLKRNSTPSGSPASSVLLTLALAVTFPDSSCLAKLFLLDGFDFSLLHNKSTILTFLHLHSLEGEDHDVPASEKLWALVHEQSVPADIWCCCLPPK